ncbi:MAG: SpoIID/LytB domain-containing protein [Endomicrobium sp.]|jgi:stage II sporulation protein D|nr:SpoIID/LytB domain-containing protein [Endomicrobium sp.]
MNKKKIFVIIVLIISLFYYNSYALNNVQKNVSVGIILDIPSCTIGSSKDFFVLDASNKRFKLAKGTVIVLSSKNGVRLGKYNLTLPVRIESSDNKVFVNSNPYSGYLVLKKSANKINVINVLPIEDYIKGVLPKEVGVDWKMEALKTQAVVSRTYVVSNFGRHAAQGFDMCATVHCQVYGGLRTENRSTNQAVTETKRKVLSYKGQFAQTVFHANCGGNTEDPKHVWNLENAQPYLKSIKCGYCYNAPYSKWEQELDIDFINKKLTNNNINIGKIKNIKIKKETSSSTVKEVEISHSKGKLILNAYKFRLNVDPWKIKSHTFSSIKKYKDKICFKGSGWGHKVGLCQWGAKGMSENGKTYKEILEYFYPGTKVETVTYKK